MEAKTFIRVSGGLGNQMFQYAFYKFLLSKGVDVYLDIDWINLYRQSHMEYKLNYFNLIPRVAQFRDYCSVVDLPTNYTLRWLFSQRLDLSVFLRVMLNKA